VRVGCVGVHVMSLTSLFIMLINGGNKAMCVYITEKISYHCRTSVRQLYVTEVKVSVNNGRLFL